MFFFQSHSGSKKRKAGWLRSSKPLIGVTGPTKGFWPAWICIRYLVWMAGGKAVKITPKTPDHLLNELDMDGLILSGGADVNPALYQEKLIKTIRTHSKQINIW